MVISFLGIFGIFPFGQKNLPFMNYNYLKFKFKTKLPQELPGK